MVRDGIEPPSTSLQREEGRAVDPNPNPHSFSLLDPDPGKKNLKITTDKMLGNW